MRYPTGVRVCRLEEEKGIRIRFTTGLVPDEYKDEIAEEESKYGEFLRIPIKVCCGPISHHQMQDWLPADIGCRCMQSGLTDGSHILRTLD